MRRATRCISAVPVLLLLLLLVHSGGCTVSEQQELEMGQRLHGKFERESGGPYPDPHVQQYVDGVGQSMARYAGRPQLPWKFAVVNSAQVNAFAVPGGYVYITQGLLFRLTNEAQLAGVLGHEAGHIAGRHSARQIGRQRTTSGLATVAGVVGSVFGYNWVGDVSSVAASVSIITYSRNQERDADMLGLRYMTQANYNPLGMVQLMEILQSASGKSGGRLPEFLSTHPNPGNRLGYLKETIGEKYVTNAQSGELGEENFRRNVLARRPTAWMTIDLDTEPASWCFACRAAGMIAADE